jgi:hypothetical protein
LLQVLVLLAIEENYLGAGDIPVITGSLLSFCYQVYQRHGSGSGSGSDIDCCQLVS